MNKFLPIFFVLTLLLCSCSQNVPLFAPKNEKIPFVGFEKKELSDSLYYIHGFGSSLDFAPGTNGSFYALNDRGPNYLIKEKEANVEFGFPTRQDKSYRGFADTSFNLAVYHIERNGNEMERVRKIVLCDIEGKPLNGMPRSEDFTEIPVVLQGKAVKTAKYSYQGFDTEGIAVLKDSSFWVSDEYGPFLLHFDKNGKMIHPEIGPNNAVHINGKIIKLPWVLSKRRLNAGMEGLCAIKNDSVLVGIMQRPLNNYTKYSRVHKTSVKARSRLIRIIMLNVYTGETQQYGYIQQKTGLSNSEIRAINDSTFLVVERDGLLPGTIEEDVFKRVYKISISSECTNLNDPQDGSHGKLIKGQTPEELSFSELEKYIVPVRKELFLDVIKEVPEFSCDKLEGIVWDKQNKTLIMINDNDFGISFNPEKGKLEQKFDAQNMVDQNYMYYYHFDEESFW